jgi:hypothetical protein
MGQCKITVNAGQDMTVCAGGQVNLLATAPGAITYTWGPASTLSGTTVASPVASPLTTTAYNVNVTDANGCIGSDTVVVTVKQLPIANAGADMSYCLPTASSGIQLNGNAQYTDSSSWTTTREGGTFSSYLSLSPVFTPAAGDTSTNFTFILSCIAFPGCYDTDTVKVKRLLQPMVNAGIDQELKDTSLAWLNGSATNASATSWSTTGTGIFIQGSSATLNPLYQASSADLLHGDILFVLNAAYVPGCPPATDTMRVNFITGLSISGNIIQSANPIYGTVLLFQLVNQSYVLLGSKSFYSGVPYSFSSLANGTYLVLAQPNQYEPGFIPTYYGGDTSWTSASPVVLSNASLTGINISPVTFVPADPAAFNGTDVIQGTVTEAPAGNVRTSGNTPVPNATVYLLNAQGKTLAFTYSDANGNFSFTNLVQGQYTLQVDYAGAQIEKLTAAVDGNPNTVTQSDLSLKKDVITSTIAKEAESSIEVYPNPANDVLYLKNQEGTCQVTIYDLSGKAMIKTTLEGNARSIQVQDLSNGIYMVEVIMPGKVVQKKFSKIY